MKEKNPTLKGVNRPNIGRLIRRYELADLCGHSISWLNHIVREPDCPFTVIRSSKGRVLGFTSESVERFMKGGC